MNNKKKIADSIIIRVGGGIREVPRKPINIEEKPEPDSEESGFEQAEDLHRFGTDKAAGSQIESDRIIN